MSFLTSVTDLALKEDWKQFLAKSPKIFLLLRQVPYTLRLVINCGFGVSPG